MEHSKVINGVNTCLTTGKDISLKDQGKIKKVFVAEYLSNEQKKEIGLKVCLYENKRVKIELNDSFISIDTSLKAEKLREAIKKMRLLGESRVIANHFTKDMKTGRNKRERSDIYFSKHGSKIKMYVKDGCLPDTVVIPKGVIKRVDSIISF